MKRGLVILSFFLSVLMGAQGLVAESGSVPVSDPYQKIRGLTSVKLYHDTGLIRAIKQHDVQKVQASLLHGGSPNMVVGSERQTPLMIAVKSLIDFVETPADEEGIITSIGIGMSKLMVGALCACAGWLFVRPSLFSLLHPSENPSVIPPLTQPSAPVTGGVPAAAQTSSEGEGFVESGGTPGSAVPVGPAVVPGVELGGIPGAQGVAAEMPRVEPVVPVAGVVPPVAPQVHVGVPVAQGAAQGIVPENPVVNGGGEETFFGRVRQQGSRWWSVGTEYGSRVWNTGTEYGSRALNAGKAFLMEMTRIGHHFPATAHRVDEAASRVHQVTTAVRNDLYPKVDDLVNRVRSTANRVDDLVNRARNTAERVNHSVEQVTNKAHRLLDGLMVLGGGSVGLYGVHQGISGTYRLAAMPVKSYRRTKAIDEYFQIIEMLLAHPATDVTIRSEGKKGSQQILEYIRDAQLDVSDECYEMLCDVEDMVSSLVEPDRLKDESK